MHHTPYWINVLWLFDSRLTIVVCLKSRRHFTADFMFTAEDCLQQTILKSSRDSLATDNSRQNTFCYRGVFSSRRHYTTEDILQQKILWCTIHNIVFLDFQFYECCLVQSLCMEGCFFILIVTSYGCTVLSETV